MLRISLVIILLQLLFPSVVRSNDYAEIFSKFYQSDYKVKLTRGQLLYWDKDFYKQNEVKSYKFNRSLAVVNMTYEFRYDVGYDLQGLVQVKKFASNEYRMFPIRFQFPFCATIDANVAGFGRMYERDNPGMGCPLVKNYPYRLINFHTDDRYLPPFIPSGEYKVELTMLYKGKNMSFMESFADIFRPILTKD